MSDIQNVNADSSSDPSTGSLDVVLGDGGTTYSPSAWQQQILAELGGPQVKGQPLSEIKITMLLYMMQGYGQQVVGLDASVQSHVNQYMSYIQDLSTQNDRADHWDGKGVNPTTAFNNDLNYLKDALTTDSFFTTGAGAQVASQLMNAINSIEGIQVKESDGTTIAFSADPNALQDAWASYNGSAPTSGSTAAPTNDPSAQNSIMSQKGNLNQLLMGTSKAWQSQTQLDVTQQQAELSAFNAYALKLNSWISMLIQGQKTQ